MTWSRACLSMLLVAAGCTATAPTSTALRLPDPTYRDGRSLHLAAGQEGWTECCGSWLVPAPGSVVTIDAVELIGLPENVEVFEILAARYSDGAGPAPLSWHGRLPGSIGYPARAFHSVTEVVLRPGEPQWYLVAGIRSSVPGEYTIDGWRIRYSEGRRKGVLIYRGEISLTVAQAA